ncbi:MAG TPA: alpha/beta hydrolase, partial [Longimicrobiaceae bacterium]|nr:alpha/beta hydrolase [Longimicrobiaceae bacterium]
ALERTAAEIRRPVLLVHGSGDRLVPPENAERLARAIPGAELALLPGLTHFGTAIAPETAERVRDWVRCRAR